MAEFDFGGGERSVMSGAEMKVECEKHGRNWSAVRSVGRVSLPNHLTPEPLAPPHALRNRVELWWFRFGSVWKLA